MTRFTDCEGKQIILCDNCRRDMTMGESVFSFSPGKVSDGYISRDYDKGEIVLCPTCAEQVTRMVTLLSDISIRGGIVRQLGFGRAVATVIQPAAST